MDSGSRNALLPIYSVVDPDSHRFTLGATWRARSENGVAGSRSREPRVRGSVCETS